MSGEKHAPDLPDVVDEAGNSAPWVSQVGVLLFVVVAIIAAAQFFGTRPEAAPKDGAAEAPAEP